MRRSRRVSRNLARPVQGPGGALWRAASEGLSGIATRLSQMADRAAEVDGAQAGAQAGLDPEFRPERDNTIRGRSFERAALRSVQISTESMMREELATAFDEAGSDPVAFQTRANEIRAARVETLPAEIRPALEAGFARQRFGYEREFVRQQQAVARDAERADLESILETSEVELGRLAYQLGLDDQADTILTDELADLQTKLLFFGPREAFEFQGETVAADPDRAGALSLEDAMGMMARAGDLVARNRVKGAFSRLGGLAEQKAFLGEFREDYATGDGVPAVMSLDEFESLEREMESDIRAGEAAARANRSMLDAQIREIRAGLREYRSYASDGLTPPPDVIAGFRAQAAALGDPGLIGEINDLARLTEIAGAAAKTSPIELQNEINRRRSSVQDGASLKDASEIGTLEAVLTGMTSALNQDPMSYAIRAGVVPPIPLLGEDGLTLSLNGRAAAARVIESTYGVPGAMFTKPEMAQFEQIEAAGGAEMVTLAAELSTGLDANMLPVLEQISDRAPLLSHLVGLSRAGGAQRTIEAAARGQTLLAEKDGVSAGFDVEAREAAQKLLEPILPGGDGARATIEQTARAIYVGHKGLNAEFDMDVFERSIQEAAGAVFAGGRQFGGIVSVGEGRFDGLKTSRVVLPSWIEADQAESVFQALTLEDYERAGGAPLYSDGSPVPLDVLRESYLTTVAPGRYRLSLRRPGSDDEMRLVSDAGDYVLDLDRLREDLTLRGVVGAVP